MRAAISCFLTAAAACGSPSAAEQQGVRRLDGTTISTAEVDDTVTRLMRAAEVTGVGIAILNDGNVAYLKAYGFRDKEKKLPLTENSVMAGASFSKAVFSYLVMQLVDEARIDLDKPVTQYLPKPLPEYPDYRDLANDQRHTQITARMLLSHTSGFPNLRWLNDDRKLNINFEPGSRYAYSGEGIQLLQLVVETIMRRPLGDLMRERVFEPLGMTRSSMVSESRFENDLANGYDEWGRSLGPQHRKKSGAAGSMQTTLGDITRFIQAVMQGKRLRSSTLELMLSPQIQILSKHQFPTLELQTTDANKPIRLSYGLGWGLYWTPYGKAFFKEGHDSGFRHYMVIFDQRKTGMVIMTNNSNGEGIFKELLENLLKNTFTPIEWEGFTPYSELPPREPVKAHKVVSVEPKTLDGYVGQYAIPGVILTVTREGSHLFLRENEEPKVELFPESERQFFSKTADDTVAFEVDSQGRSTAMVLHTGGRDIRIKRKE
jgi:CubicO group peptidase (beta-lactamase class C family)